LTFIVKSQVCPLLFKVKIELILKRRDVHTNG
jgi:hypothetical protein